MDLGAAIGVAGWFIQVVFDKYITYVLEKWASQVGLNKEYNDLREKLEYIQIVLGSAQGGKGIKNVELVNYIPKVQYIVYQAEDLLDEMQYYRLQFEIESNSGYSDVTSSSAHQDSVSLVSKLKNCIPISRINDAETSVCKRKIEGDHGLGNNKRSKFQNDDLSRRIHIMVEKLDKVGQKLYKVLKLEKLDRIINSNENTNTTSPLKCSHLVEPRVFGRDEERSIIIRQLIGDNFANSNVSILPIVGNGGVGKTTLARLVFSDPKVKEHFELRIWIYVSVDFDEGRIIHELLEYVPKDERKEEENLNRLLEILKKFLSSKRFLIVLDDMWEDNDVSKWERLRSLAECGGKNGSVILLTTRKLSVAKIVDDQNMIKLDGLKENDIWDLFTSYAFGNEKYKNFEILEKIGKEICNKLSGYPLVAKTVGAMLKKNPDSVYWKHISDNEDWKSQNGPDGIMPALRLSYESLPFHLQKCFSFFSLFHKGFYFNKEDIINIWIAQGFICLNNNTMRAREIGAMYLDNLVDSCFVDKRKEDFNCEHAYYYDTHDLVHEPTNAYYYVIHDLVHDLAHIVSQHECLTIYNSNYKTRGLPNTIRHLSIITETFSPSFTLLDESNSFSRHFERILVEVQNHLNIENLSTLIIIGTYNSNFAIALKKFLQRLKRLRVLMISIMSHDIDPLTCNFSEFIHLRYLQLKTSYSQKIKHKKLPEGLNKLYQLEILDLRKWFGSPRLPENMNNLVSLCGIQTHHSYHYESRVGLPRIAYRDESLGNTPSVGNLTALQELKRFQVKKEIGFEITQLGTLTYLGGLLAIYNLENVESKEEAFGARLEQKSSLTSQYLYWDQMSGDSQAVIQADVVEGLKPNPNIKQLKIFGYGGVTSPTWLTDNCILGNLVSLSLESCIAWVTLPPLGHLLSLKKLSIKHMSAVKEINYLFYGSTYTSFQSLEEIEVINLPEFERWMGRNECQAFPCLKTLIIKKCPKLAEFLPLEYVSFGDPDNKKWFLNLCDLTIRDCTSLNYLCWQGLHGLANLKRLIIGDCPNLFSSFRPHEHNIQTRFLSRSLEVLEIFSCDITGEQLSYLLLNLQNLYRLFIQECCQITSLVVEPKITACFPAPFSSLVGPAGDKGLLKIPLLLKSSLKMLMIWDCPYLVFICKEGLGNLTSIEDLNIKGSPNLFSHMVSGEQIDGSSLLPPHVKNLNLDELPNTIVICSLLAPLTSLSSLSISQSPQFLSLKLPSCSALKTLSIENCEMLSSLEGLKFPVHLESLYIRNCPNLVVLNPEAVRLESTNLEFVALVDDINTDNIEFISYLVCKQLSTLKTLSFCHAKVVDLTVEQEKAFLLLTSLKKLKFWSCSLNSLPNQLCNLSSLKTLDIYNCKGIKSLPENGLPSSLERLNVSGCSDELNLQCKNVTYIKSVSVVD